MASGSIRKRRGKRGTTYQVVIELGTVAGQRRQKTATYKRRKDAQEYLTKTLHELNSGAYIEPSSMPLNQYAPHWFETIDVGDASRVNYQGVYDRHIAPVFGELPLGQITPSLVQTWVNNLRRRYRSTPQIVMVLQSILKQAVRERLLLVNPCADIRVGARETVVAAAPRDAWSAQQLATFLDATRDDPDWPAWWVMAHTGMRPGELVALRWGDVDFERRTLHIQRTQTMIAKSGERVTGARAKNRASDRVIGIDPQTVLVLRGVWASQQDRRRRLGSRWEDDDLIFDRGDGQLRSANLLSRRFARAVECLDVPPITLHGLRGTHGSLLAMSGRPLHYIQHRLGHADIGTTSRYYLHLIVGTEHDDAERFAELIRAARRGNSETA